METRKLLFSEKTLLTQIRAIDELTASDKSEVHRLLVKAQGGSYFTSSDIESLDELRDKYSRYLWDYDNKKVDTQRVII